jgi:hypothetical protein
MSFHVFLSHSSADKPAVEELARRLAKEGVQAWLDKWNLIPGNPFQPDIERALAESETCAVFIGPSGFGPWQNEEMRAAIDKRVGASDRRFRVIPVLLPGAKRAERSSLPTFLAATTWVEFTDSLDDPVAFHRLVSGIRGLEPGPGPGQAISEGQCPYRGLRIFDVDDSPFFFGREALVEWLLNELCPAAEGQPVSRFLGIVGASGSGKSSLARAGLVAAIKHDGIKGSSLWPVIICRPGPDPIESLAVALSRMVNIGQGISALSHLLEALKEEEKTLHLVARQSLPDNAPQMRLVVLVDQFEEVFTECREEALRNALVRNLLYAARIIQGQTLVILTMRADFYGKCAVDAALAAAFSDHHVLVGPMTDEELRRAIERPAQLVGCELESGLVDLLVQEVRNQPGALPLLQHVLLELWNKRAGRHLTVNAYREIGGLQGGLQQRADATLKAFSAEEQELCRRIFLRLTQPAEGTEDIKRRASIEELLSLSEQPAKAEEIIRKLANASLLTTEGDLSHQGAFVEVAHEALIRNWPHLRKWLDEKRTLLRVRESIWRAAREWHENSGQEVEESWLVHRGRRLEDTLALSNEKEGLLDTLERAYLAACVSAQNRENARKDVQRRRNLAETGWGVIFSQSADPAIKQALSQLLEHRRKQACQTNAYYYREFFGEFGYQSGESKRTFLQRHGVGSGPFDPAKVPYYLLIVGEPGEIPFSFQYQLDVQYAVGRIHFDTVEDYARYARSVVAAETGQIALPRRVTFFSPRHHFDAATRSAQEKLIRPLAERIANQQPTWTVQTLLGDEATKARLSQLLGGNETPALLFSATHGGAQGELLTQDWPGFDKISTSHWYSAEDVTEAARILGMITFFFGGSAGTPEGDKIPGRAFIACLPKRLLSHPAGGALAVVGHVDTAWAYSFDEGIEHFVSALNRLLDGHPVGSAMEAINQRYAELAAVLAEELYGSELYEAELNTGSKETKNLRRAVIDARNWIVIGDPAVRLPLKEWIPISRTIAT